MLGLAITHKAAPGPDQSRSFTQAPSNRRPTPPQAGCTIKASASPQTSASGETPAPSARPACTHRPTTGRTRQNTRSGAEPIPRFTAAPDPTDPPAPLRVLIAGGGVAGLETLLALRHLAGDRTQRTLLTPEHHFAYRPMAVAEPFSRGYAQHHHIAAIANHLDAHLIHGTLTHIDNPTRTALTSTGAPADVQHAAEPCLG